MNEKINKNNTLNTLNNTLNTLKNTLNSKEKQHITPKKNHKPILFQRRDPRISCSKLFSRIITLTYIRNFNQWIRGGVFSKWSCRLKIASPKLNHQYFRWISKQLFSKASLSSCIWSLGDVLAPPSESLVLKV